MTLNEYVKQIVIELKVRMEQNPLFPFDDGKRQAGQKPRPQFKPHMRNVALKNNPILVLNPDIQIFEIGNETAERTAPQYHILEDAKQIMNPYRGTRRSKGSQAKIQDKAKRDYSTMIQGESSTGYVQEYRQSFKEGRRNYQQAQDVLRIKGENMAYDKKYQKNNVPAKFRYNKHYAYIERILEKEVPQIASSLNITLESYRGLNVAETPSLELFADTQDNGFLGGLGI